MTEDSNVFDDCPWSRGHDGSAYTALPFVIGHNPCILFFFNDAQDHASWIRHLSVAPYPSAHFRSWDVHLGLGLTSEDGRNGLLAILHDAKDPMWITIRESKSIHFFTPSRWMDHVHSGKVTAEDLMDDRRFIYAEVPVLR